MSEVANTQSEAAAVEAFGHLADALAAFPGLAFAVLVGSRAESRAHPDSDWDIALQWHPATPWMQTVADTETLRRHIAGVLKVAIDRIDLIDLSRANLAMRANAAENGRVLLGEDTLAWARFQTRTWRELEDYYWEQSHAS